MKTFLKKHKIKMHTSLYALVLTSLFFFTACEKETDYQDVNQNGFKYASSSVSLNLVDISATTEQSSNPAENAIDDELDTRWSGEGTSVDLIVELSSESLVDYLKIAFYKGDERTNSFDVYTLDGSTGSWVLVGSKTSSGNTEGYEIFDISNTTSQYVKLTCLGNSTSGSDWNSIFELQVWGTEGDDNGDDGDDDGGDDDDGDDDGGDGDDTYAYPYAITKFQDAISQCKLQAPESSTIATCSELMAGYTSEYFYVGDDDKMAFYQTGSSKRTELRFEENWYINSGSRSAHANLKFISQSGEEVTFMQIHDDANKGDGPNKPLLRLCKLKSDGHIYAVVKTDDGGDNDVHIDCGSAPSGYFDCDISISSSTLTVKIDGSTKVSRSVSYWDYPSYWKAGVYNQNSGGTTIYFNELTWN